MADDAKINTNPIFDVARKAVLASRDLRAAIHDMVPFVGEDVRFPLTDQDPELAAIIKDGKDSVPNDPDAALAMLERIDQLGRDRKFKEGQAAEQSDQPAKTEEPPPPVDADGLRLDGPTLDEWLKAGYTKEGYPPPGYASKEPLAPPAPAEPPPPAATETETPPAPPAA